MQVGRLPVMASSNIMHDSLTGKLDTIEFDDIFSGKQNNYFSNF